MIKPLSRSTAFLIVLLGTSGILHFARPAPFVSIVPKMLPHKKNLVYVSGAIELLGAGLMTGEKSRRWGGALSAALLIAVFPANVSAALRSGRRPGWYRAALWVRLPLQIPLVQWAWRSGREGQRTDSSSAT